MRFTIKVHDKFFKPFITKDEIQTAVKREADRISKDYLGKNPLFLIVLKGAFVFASDLMRAMSIPVTVETISVRSYGNSLQSSGVVSMAEKLPDVKDRHVIIVEDIVDTGLTLHTLKEKLWKEEPASVEIAAFLIKPEMRKVEIDVRYSCFSIPPAFVVGYGLDYAEQGRNLPAVYQLHATELQTKT